MATFIVGLVLFGCFFFALRHVVRNIRDGKHDCCGSDDCSGACQGCGGACHHHKHADLDLA